MASKNPEQAGASRTPTKGRILAAARKSFDRQGYEATNIRDLAKQAGVATGTVLLHFKDKQDLLHSAFFEDLERRWTQATEAVQHHSLEEDLVALAGAVFDYYGAHQSVAADLVRESEFAGEPWHGRYQALRSGTRTYVTGVIRSAQESAVLSPEVDPEALAATVQALHGYVLRVWLRDGLPEPLRLFRQLLTHTLAPVAETKSKGKKAKKDKKHKHKKEKKDGE